MNRTTFSIEKVALSAINTSPAESRAMDQNIIDDYVAEIKRKAERPVVVFFDGEDYWLGDGLHRMAAVKKCRRKAIWCDIRAGGYYDAVSYSNYNYRMGKVEVEKKLLESFGLESDDGEGGEN